MSQQQIVYTVLGGAGAMGQIIVKDLIETASKDAQIWIADYNLAGAKKIVQSTSRKGMKAIQVNIQEPEQIQKSLKGTTVLINSLPYEYNLQVMELSLALKSHYTDLGGLFHTTRKQMPYAKRFEEAGITAVLGMGAAPGTSNMLACLAAQTMEKVEEIHIRLGSVNRTRYKPKPALAVSYSFKTIMEEFSFPPVVLRKGRYRELKPMSGLEPYRFSAPVGLQYPMYTIHSEVVNLAESYRSKGVQEVSFKIAFDRDFVEKVRFLRDLGLNSHEPITIKGHPVAPIDLIDKVLMSQPAPEVVGKPFEYEIIRAVVKGIEGGKKVTRINDCHCPGIPEWGIGTDSSTGIPPSIAAQMLGTKEIKRPGVFPPEQILPTESFFKQLAKRKMTTDCTLKKGWQIKV